MSFAVNVDPTNPGQFFACCGLLELADRLWPDPGAEGWFADGQFHVACAGILTELITTIQNTMSVPLEPGNEETSPLWLPDPFRLRLDWWTDTRGGGKAFKTWSGQQTVVRIARLMHDSLCRSGAVGAALLDYSEAVPDPNDTKKAVSPFYFDARRAAGAQVRDIGFSPDAQTIKTISYPAVEYLALVGLQRFRPLATATREFAYCTWSHGYAPEVAAPVASGSVESQGATAYGFGLLLRTQYLKGFLPATRLEVSHARAD
jgi:CRISPR-associated protein Csb3